MLQNRVDPRGMIIKTAARGSWMGNRGLLHDAGQQVLRPFKLRAWLICQLEFKGWKRPVMAPNRYTELFFLDEATAYAAGHRPCLECRRPDFNRFKTCWLQGNPEYGFTEKTSIKAIDSILHAERVNARGEKVTYKDELANLPDGVFILLDEEPCLLANGALHHWTPFGYDDRRPLDGLSTLTVLTPRSTVNAFRAGVRVQMGV